MMNTQQNWDGILNEVIRDFSADVGTLHWLNREDKHLYLAASKGRIPDHVRSSIQCIPLGKGIAGTAAKTEEPCSMCNLQTDTSGIARPAAKDTKAQGSLCVPIFNKKHQVVGTLGIGYVKEHAFSEEETKHLEDAANVLSEKYCEGGR
ncbi:MAG: GAF domain-containing protein [Tatlockia sp.]|jgi:putative methionine-R-sulfoxide reductase with GAF domain